MDPHQNIDIPPTLPNNLPEQELQDSPHFSTSEISHKQESPQYELEGAISETEAGSQLTDQREADISRTHLVLRSTIHSKRRQPANTDGYN